MHLAYIPPISPYISACLQDEVHRVLAREVHVALVPPQLARRLLHPRRRLAATRRRLARLVVKAVRDLDRAPPLGLVVKEVRCGVAHVVEPVDGGVAHVVELVRGGVADVVQLVRGHVPQVGRRVLHLRRGVEQVVGRVRDDGGVVVVVTWLGVGLGLA